MGDFEISKPVGIAAAVITTVLVAAGIWFAVGRQQGDPTKPDTRGVPAVAGPGMAPPDANSGIPSAPPTGMAR